MKNQTLKIEYSQNFLRDPALVNELLDKSDIEEGDVVYEVGPGKGIITQELAKRCAKVIAVEKDEKLYSKLKERFLGNPGVEIRLGDFLKEKLPVQEKYKVFSNIPFFVTADIIRKLTVAKNPPKDCYLIMQKEAVQKYAGKPRETQSSLLLKPWFELRVLHYFKGTDFLPVPNVDVLLFQMKKRQEAYVEPECKQLYKDFIVYGFNQWKPTLKKSFEKIFTYTQFKRLASDLGFDLKAKPTDLNFDQWVGLFNFFRTNLGEDKKQLICWGQQRLSPQQTRLRKIHRTRPY
ncbi:23S ribosomal RNA methyltransferase Erm [Dehalococcoidia bacterium]|nr:23S ribosomal RNA methyltransferase Erm [Dehalococcoidia bacterium]